MASATAADNLLLCPPIYQLWQVSIMGVIIKITLVLQLTNLHRCTLLKATSYYRAVFIKPALHKTDILAGQILCTLFSPHYLTSI